MKLFLASSLADSITELIPRLTKPLEESRVLFIANAADPYPDAWWNANDRAVFTSRGATVTGVDLRSCTAEDMRRHLSESDIVHVGGGSIFYLLHLLKKTGLDNVLRTEILKGNILYTSSSAGSIIVANDVSIYSVDEEEKQYGKELTEYTGLGLVDLLIIPHCNNPEFAASNKAIVDMLPVNPVACVLLHDHQALWVEQRKLELISVSKK